MAVSAEQLIDEEPVVATPHLRLVADDEDVVAEETTPKGPLDLLDEPDAEAEYDEEERGGPAVDVLRTYVRQIGNGALLNAKQERELARLQGSRRRGRQAPPDRVQPAPRDLDRQGVRALRAAAARPDPGRQPRPHPCSREVRLHEGLQALDLRHLVDPPVHVARNRRPGPHDPPARARRGHGQAPASHQSRAHAGARPRRHRRGARRGHGAAPARASSS